MPLFFILKNSSFLRKARGLYALRTIEKLHLKYKKLSKCTKFGQSGTNDKIF